MDQEDLGDVIVLDLKRLAFENGVELDLVDVDVNPVGIVGFGKGVFAEGADVEDNPGEIGVGMTAEPIDLDGWSGGSPYGDKCKERARQY